MKKKTMIVVSETGKGESKAVDTNKAVVFDDINNSKAKQVLEELIEISNKQIDDLITNYSNQEGWVIIDSNEKSWAVVSSDDKDKSKADVSLADKPFIFHSLLNAEKVSRNFKAWNGFGPFVWKVVKLEEWYKTKLDEKKETLQMYIKAVENASK